MNRYLKPVFVLLLVITGTNSLAQIKEITKISSVYMDFIKAVEKNDGAEAVKYADDSTIAYFGTLLPFIKNYDEHATADVFTQHSSVIKWLHDQLPAGGIDNLQVGDFLKFIISSGTYSKLNLQRFHPGRIFLDGDKAKALLTTFSTTEQTECAFVKDGKKWKISLQAVTAYMVDHH